VIGNLRAAALGLTPFRKARGLTRIFEGDPMALVLLDIDPRGVATATLNRPEVGNAYNEELLAELIAGVERLALDPTVRCLVLRGAGKHFQAGADVTWLGRATHYPPEQNYAASMATTRAMQRLNEFPKPTIALVHGACFGGGCGMVCCVDVAFATPDAVFGLTEVRVGVAPTPISTQMVHAMGLPLCANRRAVRRRRSGSHRAGARDRHSRCDGSEAHRDIGCNIPRGAGAIAVTKRSFLGANGLLLNERQMSLLAHESWIQRQGPEGHEGTTAFREKRRPSWYRPPVG
jgi:methylglutaconyl-CoA hydratase